MSDEPTVKPGGQKAYVLYIGIKEYNGDFKEEVIFRNCWYDHAVAKIWLQALTKQIESWMGFFGVFQPLKDEKIFLTGESSAPAESVE